MKFEITKQGDKDSYSLLYSVIYAREKKVFHKCTRILLTLLFRVWSSDNSMSANCQLQLATTLEKFFLTIKGFTLTLLFTVGIVGMATSTNFEPIRAKGGYLSTNQLSVFRWYRFRSYLIDQVPIIIQIISKDLLYCLSKNVIYIQLTGDKENCIW